MNNELIDKNEIDFLDLLAILIKYRVTIVVITSITSILILLIAIISLLLPPNISPFPNIYKPTSTIRVNSGIDGGGFSSLLGGESEIGSLSSLIGISPDGNDIETSFIIKLAQSNMIIDQIASEFELLTIYDLQDEKYPVTKIRKEIRERFFIDRDSSSGTLSISYEDLNRELATSIVNRVVDIIDLEIAQLDESSTTSQRVLIEGKLIKIEEDILNLQKKLLDFQDRYNVLDANTLASSVGNRLVSLRTSLVEKEAAIATYQTKSRIEDPSLIKLKDEKNAIENTLSAMESGSVNGLPAIHEIPKILIEYEEIIRNIELQSTIYKTLRQQYELLKLHESGTAPTFQIIEYAEIPERKYSPSWSRICVYAFVSSFFISVFLVFFLEFIHNIKNDPERMKKLKGQV